MFETSLQSEQSFDEMSSSPTLTTSPSQGSEASELSASSSQSRAASITSEKPHVKLTWLEEDHTHSKPRSKRKLAPQPEGTSASVISSESSPASSSSESHSETSCTKCRLTEMEARKCRVERRREQNRASQRKFRARKEAKIRDAVQQVSTLEVYVEFLEKQNDDLEATNARIFRQLEDLRRLYETPRDTNINLLLPDRMKVG